MLWRYGYLDGLFQHFGHTNAVDVNYGDIKRIPMYKKEVTDNTTKAFVDTILQFGSFADTFGSTKHGTVLSVVDEVDEFSDED